jgi:hypothetical protein
MNNDTKTTEYLATLTDIKLSDSSRARIQNNLQEYAAFHTVRDVETSRSIEGASLTTSLFSLRFTFMPFVILLAVMIGGGTTFAAQSSVPGDFLYPVKTGVNENIRGALAISADSEAEFQTSLLEERLEEAQVLLARGEMTEEMSARVATNISTQTEVANNTSDFSSADVSARTKVRIDAALKTYFASVQTGDVLAIEATSLFASDLADGLYDINAYREDMTDRTVALAEVIAKHQTKIAANVKSDLSVKVDAASKLTAEAYTQTEDNARVALDKAAALTGEVESKLSTLGQVEIDVDTGMITDIDFSIDPMMVDRGDGNGVNAKAKATSTSSTASGTDASFDVTGSLDSGMIDATTDAAASGGINLGL